MTEEEALRLVIEAARGRHRSLQKMDTVGQEHVDNLDEAIEIVNTIE